MLLSRDSSVQAANRAKGEWLRKVKEDKKRKRQRKLQVREQREDTDSDDDDDDGDDDEVADDVEWDILENKDALTEGTWDRLIEEARLHREVTAQLVAAQQRVAQLTPLIEEVDDLRSRVAKARRHAVEAEKAFEALLERSRRDDKEAAKVRKEWDELLQMNAETRQWILDLLAEVEKQRELKLGAKEKLTALEKKASLDALAIARLRKEQDELLQTMERLRLECGVAHEEHDQAFREHDQACLEHDDT
ncbi:stress response protein NST1-like [Miscanthus floridulus]|uniref:stress response protein NST1-like n=1 Tax=Miscanthus floridulus TaxID=154761 RepID=UPI00345A4A85